MGHKNQDDSEVKLTPEKTWVPLTAVAALLTGLVSFVWGAAVLSQRVDAHQDRLNRQEEALQRMSGSLSQIALDVSITRQRVEDIDHHLKAGTRP